jgi:spoIIIJ-associated protein
MKDRVFSGPSVPEALAEAATALGLPETELRYVVLETGTEGGRGLQPTPARVAILLEEPARRRAPERSAPDPPPAAPADPRAGIRATIRSVAESAGIDVWAEVEEDGDDRVVVQLKGPGHAFFFGREGKGDVLRATEHLLQRTWGAEFLPRHLRVECEGFQERRDAALAEEARTLAAAVRDDGQPRTTEPLNAYERRVVHVALNDQEGISTYSVGEGSSRRVTVARAEEAPAPDPVAAEAAPSGDDDAPA